MHAVVLPCDGTDSEGQTALESTAAEQEQSKDGSADMAARQDSDSNKKLAAKPGDDRACTDTFCVLVVHTICWQQLS